MTFAESFGEEMERKKKEVLKLLGGSPDNADVMIVFWRNNKFVQVQMEVTADGGDWFKQGGTR